MQVVFGIYFYVGEIWGEGMFCVVELVCDCDGWQFFDVFEGVGGKVVVVMLKCSVIVWVMLQGDIIGFVLFLCLICVEVDIIVVVIVEVVIEVLGQY